MILQSLHALYDRLKDDERYGIVRPGYSVQKISFRVVLREDGSLFGVEDARMATGQRLVPRQLVVPGGSKPSGQGINPCFLWDNSAYMLGFRLDDDNPERTRRSFEAFREAHLQRESAIGVPAYSAVCRFLESWDPMRGASQEVLTEVSSGFGVFRILGEAAHVHDHPTIRSWWDGQAAAPSEGPRGQCLITGAQAPIAKIHEPKIKGVAGGQSSGTVIVGFNEGAFESYGKTQSYNAPVSEAAAFRYSVALNTLLDGPMRRKHRLLLGDSTVVFWTDAPCLAEDVFAAYASLGSGGATAVAAEWQDDSLRERLEVFLGALRKGREAYEVIAPASGDTGFTILGLSPNAARLSVRFCLRGTLGDLLDNLRRHHADIAVKPRWGNAAKHPDPEFPSIRMLLDRTCPMKARRPDREKTPAILSGPLLRAIITGAPYPSGLYTTVLRRLRADRAVDHILACVVKGYLNRNLKLEVGMSLDRDRPEPAYRLGRLFSALEKTQGDALGSLNASIRDRFYGSASATPGSVFPRLFRTYQHHLSKLEGGRRVVREKLVQEILGPLTGFPAHLDLSAQGLFALGYYHQTSDFFTKKEGAAAPETGEGDPT